MVDSDTPYFVVAVPAIVPNIEELWVVAGIDTDGNEGIALVQMPSGPTLAVCIRPEDRPNFRKIAKFCQNEAKALGGSVKLLRFTNREEIPI